MRKEIIENGKTVDSAIESACEKLGCSREDCEWEILDLPKKGFLGLKVTPARVRVSIEAPDEKETVKEAIQPEKAPVRKEVPRPSQAVQSAQDVPKSDSQQSKPREEPEEESEKVLITEGFTEKENTAMDYVSGILREFGLKASLNLYRDATGSIYIDIKGDGLGTIIGRRGETLDSIQYLTGLVANRLEGDYIRVTVDCGKYRVKRKETLEALARKLASQVLKTNVSKTLEPMNPFERRVIHATVSTIDGVSSSSIGDEPNRRVVITSPTARRPAPRHSRGGRDGDRRPPRSGGRGGDRDRDRRRPPQRGGAPRGASSERRSPASSGPPKQTPEAQVMGDAPIGKLDLE